MKVYIIFESWPEDDELLHLYIDLERAQEKIYQVAKSFNASYKKDIDLDKTEKETGIIEKYISTETYYRKFYIKELETED